MTKSKLSEYEQSVNRDAAPELGRLKKRKRSARKVAVEYTDGDARWQVRQRMFDAIKKSSGIGDAKSFAADILFVASDLANDNTEVLAKIGRRFGVELVKAPEVPRYKAGDILASVDPSRALFLLITEVSKTEYHWRVIHHNNVRGNNHVGPEEIDDSAEVAEFHKIMDREQQHVIGNLFDLYKDDAKLLRLVDID